MAVRKLEEFLKTHNITYEKITHSQVFTAQETAAVAHVSGKELAKTVILKIDGKMTMAVLQACYKVNFDLLKAATGANEVELAKEEEFKDMLPECEIGAIPPFGNIYGFEVFVEQSLAKNEKISFNAGSHTELFRLSYKDLERHLKPKVMKFSSEY
jgi:Ala-tRNA(Pro) deacylase